MIYIPNILTLIRFGLVPLLLVLLQDQQFLASLLVFLLAGISDGLDGFIAKRFNAETQLGAILDPLADKALLVSSYVMLAMMELIPFWLMIVVVFRDVIIVGGYLIVILFFVPAKMNPTKISKTNTFMQILFIILVLTQLAGLLDIPQVIQYLGYTVLLTSVLSGLNYVWIGAIKSMTKNDDQVLDQQ